MQKEIKLLADWWAEQVTTPAMNSNNGDNSEVGAMTFMLANTLAQTARQKAPSDAPEKFKAVFVELATKYYEENNRLPEMDVDYHPSAFLAEVAELSGISANAFPCKSHSCVRNGVALAKCGYGKDLQELG